MWIKTMRMHNPAHPGEILRERMGEMPVSKLAAHLRVSRVTLSRLLNGNAGVSAEMALKLSEAFSTSPDLWLNMQTQFDLWQASRVKRKRVAPLAAA
jgi:addiction module HigA family antidote